MPRSRSVRPRGRARGWCFTAHYDEENEAYHDYPQFLPRVMTYHIEGQEVCPTTGRKHVQGYVYYKTQVSFTTLHAGFPNVHFERANGSPADNQKYCSKDGDFVEQGELPVQGKRTDISNAYESIRQGLSWKDMVDEHHSVMVKYRRGLLWIKELMDIKREWEMEVFIYYGPPGSGKTRMAYDTYGAEGIYSKPKNKWWCQYAGQKTIIIDDFDPYNADWKFDYWLTLLDRYPMLLEYKGGSMQMLSKRIIITSNFATSLWFNDRPNRAAFFRRVIGVYHVVDGVATLVPTPAEPRMALPDGSSQFEFVAPAQPVAVFADYSSPDIIWRSPAEVAAGHARRSAALHSGVRRITVPSGSAPLTRQNAFTT